MRSVMASAIVVIAVGCGRFHFDVHGATGDAIDGDATTDGFMPDSIDVVAHTFSAQSAYVKASNTESGDTFGNGGVRLSADGSTLVAGAPNEASNATGVGGNQADNSLAMAGAAYVFVRSSGTWVQQAYLKASNTKASAQFGASIAVSSDGSTLVIGAYTEASNATGIDGNQADNSASGAGAAYVFVRSGTTWSQQAYVKASNTNAGDQFGGVVALSGDGDTMAIGANVESSAATGIDGNQGDNSAAAAGAIYIFTRSATVWSQQAYIKASNANAADQLGGCALSDDGSILVAGAAGERSNATGIDGNQADNSLVQAGAAYVFTRTGVTWSQQAYLKASNTGAGDQFGARVALSGDGETVVIGAPFEASAATGVDGNQADNSKAQAGAVYVFTHASGSWAQQAYLKASNTDGGDWFGFRVAISYHGTTLAITAPEESSNATGIGGNQADNSKSKAGAIYLFGRSANQWQMLQYLKASNSDANDQLGGGNMAIAANGGTLVVGAPAESSNAMGVGGNQADNSAAASGAVYVFE